MKFFMIIQTPYQVMIETRYRYIQHGNDNGAGGDNIWIDPEYITYLKHKRLKDKVSKDLKKIFDKVNKEG